MSSTDAHAGGHAHHPTGWRRWLYSTNHKDIGTMYLVFAILAGLIGAAFSVVMRIELSSPGDGIFGGNHHYYNVFVTAHALLMIFFMVMPAMIGGFGNWFVPIMIGAPDMAFPKLNMASYWVYFIGGIVMFVSFFLPGGAANSGWTSYPPLSDIATVGQTYWLIGMIFLITSSLLGSMNIIVTIIQLRAEGMTWMRLPFLSGVNL